MQNVAQSSCIRSNCLTCLKKLVMTHFICVLCPNREEKCDITINQWEIDRNVSKCCDENHDKGSIWGAFHKSFSQAKFRLVVVPEQCIKVSYCRNNWSPVIWWVREYKCTSSTFKRKERVKFSGERFLRKLKRISRDKRKSCLRIMLNTMRKKKWV